MPHNDNLIFDYHEHHDHLVVTHDHDNHPRHHHDRNGSILYNNGIVATNIRSYSFFTDNIVAGILNKLTDDNDVIGCGGNDIDRRTSGANNPAQVAADRGR